MTAVEDHIRVRNAALEEAALEIERGVRVFGGGQIQLPADMKTICKAVCDLLAGSIRCLKSIPPEPEAAESLRQSGRQT